MKLIVAILLAVFLVGCSTNSGSRYQMSQDQAPPRLPTNVETSDIKVGYEPYSRGGNKDYTVRGISYQVLKDATNYVKTGNASWYGEKFHGHLTSNGEIYNMYTLSAAHKTLPLPSFVKVTNLANNKQLVVRVNDRGPFHPERIIDLSYGAAHRLDMLKHGTAPVKIEVLTFPQKSPVSIDEQATIVAHATTKPSAQCIIQLAAVSNKLNAQNLLHAIEKRLQMPSKLVQAGELYRMQLGPISGKQQCENLLKKVRTDYPKAFIKAI